jgi:hypothetical protein
MGGASSRFDETQWWNANGELDTSEGKEGADQKPTIIPTENPTTSLEIFDILKIKSITSQRDFEIRDGSKQVFYVTRSVPGTLAWFDVLRPGISEDTEVTEEDKEAQGEKSEDTEVTEEDKEAQGEKSEDTEVTEEDKEAQGEKITEGTAEDPPPIADKKEELLLRVQVDWNRRTWTVYSSTPVFPGQLPATIPVRKGLDEGQALYKSCCITLSWGKALALVARYGPPTKLQDFWEDGDDDDDDEDKTADEPRARRESDFFTKVFFKKADTIAARARKEHVGVNTEQLRKEQTQTPTKAKDETAGSQDEQKEAGDGMMGQMAKSVKTLIDPALHPKEHSQPRLSKKEKQRLSLEGVVDLDAPLLQCQTVLGSKAIYQTCLIDKEETLKLWILDDALNKERFLKYEEMNQFQDPFRNPLAKAVAYEKEQLETDMDIEALKKWFSALYVVDDQLLLAQESDKANGKRPRKSRFSFRMSRKSNDTGDTSTEAQDDGEEESGSANADGAKASELANTDTKDESKSVEDKVYGSSKGIVEEDNNERRKEPLVAYWQWKNTYTTHKMQMHLAKNSDLALHVVLSIILNISRYEWHLR